MPIVDLQRLIEQAADWHQPEPSKAELIRLLAAEHYHGTSLRRAAQTMARDLARYNAGRWRHDHNKQALPAEYRGRRSAFFFRIMKSAEGRLIGQWGIMDILRGRRGVGS